MKPIEPQTDTPASASAAPQEPAEKARVRKALSSSPIPTAALKSRHPLIAARSRLFRNGTDFASDASASQRKLPFAKSAHADVLETRFNVSSQKTRIFAAYAARVPERAVLRRLNMK